MSDTAAGNRRGPEGGHLDSSATVGPFAIDNRRRAAARSSPVGRLCSVEEAAEHLSTSVRFVRRLVAERRIRHVKVGRYVRFDRNDLDAFLAAGVREPLE